MNEPNAAVLPNGQSNTFPVFIAGNVSLAQRQALDTLGLAGVVFNADGSISAWPKSNVEIKDGELAFALGEGPAQHPLKHTCDLMCGCIDGESPPDPSVDRHPYKNEVRYGGLPAMADLATAEQTRKNADEVRAFNAGLNRNRTDRFHPVEHNPHKLRGVVLLFYMKQTWNRELPWTLGERCKVQTFVGRTDGSNLTESAVRDAYAQLCKEVPTFIGLI